MNRLTPYFFSLLLSAGWSVAATGQSEVELGGHGDHSGHGQLAADAISEYSVFHLDSLWLNHDGQPKTLSAALAGKPTVGAMIYTACDHACPLIVNDMLNIERELGNEARDVQFTLFSMDYARDKPEQLNLYRMDKEIGQWDFYAPKDQGSELELAVALGIRIKPLANGDFAHSNVIFVLDSKGVPAHQQNGLGLPPENSAAAIRGMLTE